MAIRSVIRLPITLLLLGTFAACERAAPVDKPQPMPPVVQRLLRLADEALTRHDFDRAFALADSAAQRAPELADIAFFRGRIYTELAQSAEAEAEYRKALDIRPFYPGGWNNLGNTAFRQQQYSDAITYFRRELAAHPDARPWRGIARAFVELGMPDSARYAFERALSIDPTLSQAHFGLAQLLEDLGDFEGALAAAQQALGHGPESLEYRYYVGSYLVRLGRNEEAVPHLQEVVDRWPWHQGAHYNMGQVLARLGKTDEAQQFQARAEQLRGLQSQISNHENSVRTHPTDPFAHAGLGSLLRRAGRYQDAMQAYRVALYLAPDNLEFRNNVAVLYLLQNDTTAAIQTFEQIVRANAAYAHAWYNLGTLYAMSNQPEKARAAWNKVLEIDPTNDAVRRSIEKLPPAEAIQ